MSDPVDSIYIYQCNFPFCKHIYSLSKLMCLYLVALLLCLQLLFNAPKITRALQNPSHFGDILLS